VFTGRQLLDARTLDEVRSKQRDLERLRLTATDINLDPAVERVIMRCVDFRLGAPARVVVGGRAALLGGDPLAAALAAGETPSPHWSPPPATRPRLYRPSPSPLMVAVAGCLISAVSAAQRSAFTLLQPPYSSEVLGVQASELLQRLRPDDPQPRYAEAFNLDGNGIVQFASQARQVRPEWNRLAEMRPAPVYFWRRTSPQLMAPLQIPGGTRVSEGDPPRVTPGMTLVRTDLRGRLAYLDARPSPRDDQSTAAAAPPWTQLFREAGIDPARFAPASPEWMPPSWGDARAAWTGTIAEDPGVTLRVEAAAYRGRPTFFVIAAPWTVKPVTSPGPSHWGRARGNARRNRLAGAPRGHHRRGCVRGALEHPVGACRSSRRATRRGVRRRVPIDRGAAGDGPCRQRSRGRAPRRRGHVARVLRRGCLDAVRGARTVHPARVAVRADFMDRVSGALPRCPWRATFCWRRHGARRRARLLSAASGVAPPVLTQGRRAG
jgi:hypothetical protein